jgi:hypothetical protein
VDEVEKAQRMFLLAERVGLLLGCLRNFKRHGDPCDLDGAWNWSPRYLCSWPGSGNFCPGQGKGG